MKTRKTLAYFVAALLPATALFTTSCNSDDEHHHPNHEQELITTLRLTVVNQIDTADHHQITFRDLDGEGGQNGTITPDTLRLQPGIPYFASLQVLDESDPANTKDLTQEIEDEATSHQFHYSPQQGLNLTVNGFDTDANGLPFGQEATITTPAQATRGSLRISLIHFTSPKTGSTSTGESDIEVTFPVSVEN